MIEALNQFVKYRVSALPVVDHQRKLVNIYSKFDVIVSFPLFLFVGENRMRVKRNASIIFLF